MCCITAHCKDGCKDADRNRDALYVAFDRGPLVAWDHFIARCLKLNQSLGVYLVEPRNLSALYSAVSDHRLACAFVAVLPEHVRRLICAFFRMDPLDTNQILRRARNILKDGAPAAGLILTSAKIELRGTESTSVNHLQNCVNHSCRYCLCRRAGQSRNRQADKAVRWYRRDKQPYIA